MTYSAHVPPRKFAIGLLPDGVEVGVGVGVKVGVEVGVEVGVGVGLVEDGVVIK
jgi:hypothetical protein